MKQRKAGKPSTPIRKSPAGNISIARLEVAAYTIPTDFPESDGTLEWDRTTIVIVNAEAGGQRGLGYTYADDAVATLIHGKLTKLVTGLDAMNVTAAWDAMVHGIRNLGRPGICSMAIAAVDIALWDLKARLLGLPLVTLLGQRRASIPAYGSGGFTSYSDRQLAEQFQGWITKEGIRRLKMKVGREPERDPARVRAARQAIAASSSGPNRGANRDANKDTNKDANKDASQGASRDATPDDIALYVDANGAYQRKQALALAARFAEQGVVWFEEPVSSDDLAGLRLIRERAPAGMDIAAGEYGYDAFYFRRMLEAGAVDVLQADATRCAGITGFLQAAALCEAFATPLSAHTAPSLHAHLMCAAPRARDVEYFHDHVRIERMLFEGAVVARSGQLQPDLTRPGLGLELKQADAERFAAA